VKRPFSLTAAAGLLALAAGFVPASSLSPFELARREAERRHALVVVDFYTEWCGWCRVLDRTVYPDPDVRRQLDRAVFLRLDAEGEGADAARRFRIDGFPTIVFVDPRGTEVGRIRGFYPAPQFAERARAILDSRPRP
jgi:thiol:disulfide interchange protein